MILLDTQAVAWLAMDFEKLSPAAKAAISIARAESSIAIADKTLWELAMMWAKKKLDLDTSLVEFLSRVEERFIVLPLNALVAERSVKFGRSFPKNPSDRIIAATAIVYGLSLVTADAAIRKSGEVSCIW